MKNSTSARTKQYLEKKGWLWGKTEYYNIFTHRRVDLFGIYDGIAIKGKTIIGIQACLGDGDVAKHIRKINENPLYEELKRALPIYIFSWAKRGTMGKRKVWTVKIHKLGKEKVIKELDENKGN